MQVCRKMFTTFIISQILGGLAFIFDFASFQFKKREHIILALFVSSVLIGTHFVLLDQIAAALIIFISSIRFATSYKSTSQKIMLVFLIANLVVFIFTYEQWVNILALIATTFITYGNFRKDDKSLRLIVMAGTCCWIIHNTIIFTPALIAVEVFFLASNLLGYYRHYIRK